MICIIIISLLLLIHDTVVAKHHDDIQEILLEEKSGNFNTDTSVFRKMLKTYNVTTVKSGLDDVERRSAPYVFRWSDGRRETGDRLSTTPWDDYDFNGSKDYEYQLSFRGCRINYIQVRLLIPNDSGYSGYLDGGIQQSSVVLAIGAKAVDYFYYGVKIYVKC